MGLNRLEERKSFGRTTLVNVQRSAKRATTPNFGPIRVSEVSFEASRCAGAIDSICLDRYGPLSWAQIVWKNNWATISFCRKSVVPQNDLRHPILVRFGSTSARSKRFVSVMIDGIFISGPKSFGRVIVLICRRRWARCCGYGGTRIILTAGEDSASWMMESTVSDIASRRIFSLRVCTGRQWLVRIGSREEATEAATEFMFGG